MDEAKTNETAARKVKRILQPKPFELYDVVSDPYEIDDLSDLPEHQERIATLRTKLRKLMTDCGESTTPPEAPAPKKKKEKKNQRKPRKPSK